MVRAWLTVGALSLLYILSYADRLILSLLVEPVKRDLLLSDTQMGLLLGAAFALFYSVSGLPLGVAADRTNRRNLIAGGVVLWSIATMASAYAVSFDQLFLARMGLGLGEAALTPAALSLISDLFPAQRRTLPLSIYLAAGTFGATGSFLIGAAVLNLAGMLTTTGMLAIDLVPWRLTLLSLGGLTLIIGLSFLLVAREAPRRGDSKVISVGEAFRFFWHGRQLYLGLFAGVGVASLISFATIAWFPSHLIRSFALTGAEAGYYFGTVALVGSTTGSLLGPFMARALSRGNIDGLVDAIALSLLIAVGALGVSAMSQSLPVTLAASAVVFVGLGAMGILPSLGVQWVAPARMRGMLVSIYLLFISLVGLGLGPPLLALVSEQFFSGDAALGQALFSTALAVSPSALLLLLWCRTSFKHAALAADDLQSTGESREDGY